MRGKDRARGTKEAVKHLMDRKRVEERSASDRQAMLGLPSLDLTDEAYLELELHLLARMRLRYPEMPEELAREFARRLDAGALKPAAWNGAVVWLEDTDWFKRNQVPAADAKVA